MNDPETPMRWPTAALDWTPAYRVVPTRFPAIGLFDRVAPAEDLDALHALEALTDDRIRDEIGVLDLVPLRERRHGPGWGPVMAAFTHPNPQGSSFSDGSYGVFYCAHSRETAIAETRDHCSRFLSATKAPPMRRQMRLYTLTVQGELVDVRAQRVQHGPVLPDPLDEDAARAFGRVVHDAGGAGIVYQSVHDADGECVAAFRTAVLRDCRHAACLEYAWNGTAIDAVFELHQVG